MIRPQSSVLRVSQLIQCLSVYQKSVSVSVFREVQMRELAVILLSRSVISFCGFYLVVKITEGVGSVFAAYRSRPFFTSLVPVDTLVF